MPIFLPQLSRRAFLKRAALAGTAVVLAPGCAGVAGKSSDNNTFVFFSDPHIAADPAVKNNGVNMSDNLTAAVNEFLRQPVPPAAVIVNGDLAFKDGQPGDYATFGKLIEPVRAVAPLHLTMGNHDERENFWTAFPHDATTAKSVPQKQVTIFASEHANWFLLDTLDVTLSVPGVLGAAQLAWLNAELAARPDKPAIIVGHHNLQTPGSTDGLKTETAAMDALFARHPQVKAYIFGHTHNWNLTQHKTGVHLINLPPTGYVFTPGRPSGWVRVTLATDSMEIELRALDVKQPDHAQVKQLKWRTG